MLKESNLRKLGEAAKRLAELQEKLADATVIADQDGNEFALVEA